MVLPGLPWSSRTRRAVIVLAAVVAFSIWTATSVETTYEVHGSYLVTSVALEASPEEIGDEVVGIRPRTTDALAAALLSDPRVLPRESWDPSVTAYEVRPGLAGLLQITVQAPSIEASEALLDDVLVQARARAESGSDVVVVHRSPAEPASQGVDAALASALIGVPTEAGSLSRALRPPPNYLARVADAVVASDSRRAAIGLAPDEQVVVEQRRFDRAPVVDLRVTGASPAAALDAYARVGRELDAIIRQAQDELRIPPAIELGLEPLSEPAEARLQGDGLLGAFFGATGILTLLLLLASMALERIARGTVAPASRRGSPAPTETAPARPAARRGWRR